MSPPSSLGKFPQFSNIFVILRACLLSGQKQSHNLTWTNTKLCNLQQVLSMPSMLCFLIWGLRVTKLLQMKKYVKLREEIGSKQRFPVLDCNNCWPIYPSQPPSYTFWWTVKLQRPVNAFRIYLYCHHTNYNDISLATLTAVINTQTGMWIYFKDTNVNLSLKVVSIKVNVRDERAQTVMLESVQ